MKKISWLLVPIVLFAAVCVLFRAVLFVGVVPSASMEPTIPAGSVLLGCRVVGELRQGDVILGGIHPLLWILMPGFIALFTGIPYLMMCAKVQKVGSVLLMGLITGLIYYVTGQFTVVILISFATACILAELIRGLTHYQSMAGNLVSFVLFSVGMVGSPLPIWLMREDFLQQITEQGMPADYVNTLAALSSPGMLVVLFLAPIVGAVIGGLLAKAMFRKHFEKAGLV